MFGQPVSSLKEAAAAGGCSDSRRRRHRLRLTLILTVLSVVFVCLFADLSILLLKVERRTPMDGIASCYHYCPLTDWLADIRWCTNEKKNIINKSFPAGQWSNFFFALSCPSVSPRLLFLRLHCFRKVLFINPLPSRGLFYLCSFLDEANNASANQAMDK